MSSLHEIDVQAAAWLDRLDARVKLAWLFWMSTVAVLVDSRVALAALVVMALAAAAGLRLSARGWGALVGLVAALVWGTLASQAFFYAGAPRTALVTLVPEFEVAGYRLGGLRIYREGALYGFTQSARVVSLTLAGLVVCLSTGPERLLAAWGKLRLPASLGFMAVAALRFLPVVMGEWQWARRARGLRGGGWQMADAWRPGRWPRIAAAEVGVIVPVMAAALRRSTALATSVATRGFDPTARRTYFPPLRLRAGEWGALAALAASWLLLVATKLLLWLYLAEVYYRAELRPLYAAAREWL